MFTPILWLAVIINLVRTPDMVPTYLSSCTTAKPVKSETDFLPHYHLFFFSRPAEKARKTKPKRILDNTPALLFFL